MLSHLISLDTRHPASLKQPLTPAYNLWSRLKCCARAYAQILKDKGSSGKRLEPLGTIINAENGSNWDEDKSRVARAQGRTERLNMSLVNRDSRLSCLQVIPINIGVGVRTACLRINYKARQADLLFPTLSIAHSKHSKRVLGVQ